jgi:hypothetical protein
VRDTSPPSLGRRSRATPSSASSIAWGSNRRGPIRTRRYGPTRPAVPVRVPPDRTGGDAGHRRRDGSYRSHLQFNPSPFLLRRLVQAIAGGLWTTPWTSKDSISAALRCGPAVPIAPVIMRSPIAPKAARQRAARPPSHRHASRSARAGRQPNSPGGDSGGEAIDDSRAFSSEVDTGSREENALKQESNLEPRSDSIGTEMALGATGSGR